MTAGAFEEAIFRLSRTEPFVLAHDAPRVPLASAPE